MMKTTIKNAAKKAVSLVTCIVMSLSILSGCAKKDTKHTDDSSKISVTTIKPSDPPKNADDVDSGEIDDIYSLVCSSVAYKLSEMGFETNTGIAYTTENDNYEALGIYYYDDDFNILNNDSLKSVGFVEIVDDSAQFYQADNEESLIVVDSVDKTEDDTELICTYNYDNIGSSHFVYKNKYVTYYQQSSMRVVYTEMDNDPDNYDLELGSLYDYDNNQYLYDEDIFSGEYQTHTSAGLFTEEDYDKLEESLKAISKEQEKNGYTVEEYNIVYISPESIQAYLDSEEEDTFFGYSVSDLTAAFGLGTALEYTEDGLVEADYRQNTPEEYNWKTFLGKVGIGCGIILVGAVLTPITGGASFGVALVAISKVAIGFALSEGLGTLAVETAKNTRDGKTLVDALKGASGKGLDHFANGFILAAAVGGLSSVASSLINPIISEVDDAEKLADKTVSTLRNKAVKDAWEVEQNAVKTGTSRYNWTIRQKLEILKSGKLKGYEGHHIKTVKELEGTAKEFLIADPNDIVFVTKEQHLLLHAGNTKNATNIDTLLKLMPWADKRLTYLAKAAA